MPPKWGSKQPIYYVLGAISDAVGSRAVRDARARGGDRVRARVARDVLARTVACSAQTRGPPCSRWRSPASTRWCSHGAASVLQPDLGLLRASCSRSPLAWWAVRDRDRGAAALLALFMLVGALAYPLALPIPGLALVVFLGLDVRERRRRGEATGAAERRAACGAAAAGSCGWCPWRWRSRSRSQRARTRRGTQRGCCSTRTSRSTGWAGDLLAFIPAHEFFGLATGTLWWLAVAAMAGLAVWLLTQLPRPVGWGIGAVLVAFLGAAADLSPSRLRLVLRVQDARVRGAAARGLRGGRPVTPGPARSRLLLVLLVVSAELAARPEVRETRSAS